MNDLVSVLREAMDDETSGLECPIGAARTAWGRGRRRARYQRFAPVAAAAAVIAIAVTAVAVGAGNNTPAGVSASVGQVRCDVPTRPVLGYLAWPCPTGTNAVHNRALLGAMLRSYLRATNRPDSREPAAPPNNPWRMRVLAAEPVTGVQDGFTFLAVEVWPADRGRATILYSESGGPHPRISIGSAPRPASLPVYNTRIIRADVGVPPQVCNEAARKQVSPTRCTTVFLVRSDAASVRLLRRGEPPLTVPVRGGVAELPAGSSRPASPTGSTKRPRADEWRVQALNNNGHIIGTNNYDNYV